MNNTENSINILKKKSACGNLFWGLSTIFFHITILFIPIVICFFLQFENNFIFLVFSVFFIILNGTRMRALGNIIHECSHFNFVSSRKQNYYIGKILSALEFSCFDRYLKDHHSHHKYLGDLNLDKDFISRQIIGVCSKNKFSLKTLFKVVLSPKNWFLLIKNSFVLNYTEKKNFFIHSVTFIMIFFLCLFFGFKIIFLFLLLPFFTSYQMCKILSDYLDHGGLYYQIEKEEKTRNHIFSIPLLNAIFFPRNDCYHLVHHLYPTLPTSYLPEMHQKLIKTDQDYAKKRHNIF
ncbi:fatty acid desaturase [Pigmentibacter sp. JX0631]|uniref:fatty acid desaturase n=1 Tax=Pigmentibacter sp. JX0631 TaxID=2976982 RepID=UPI002468FF40|nr:fatty acid desaturase [Pigmentibacter sp. JX0631]WGL60347.1 fatty acid desaturase [Pigmentibacter sp. JX0631]